MYNNIYVNDKIPVNKIKELQIRRNNQKLNFIQYNVCNIRTANIYYK